MYFCKCCNERTNILFHGFCKDCFEAVSGGEKKVRERPILFSTEMVEAILEGRKTQTRRIVKGVALDWLAPNMFMPEYVASKGNNLCPYGYENDILWVRETWRLTDFLHPSDENYGYIYKASENGKEWESNCEEWYWKPSIFMPKEACRLRLKIKSIRIERLQEISEKDAIAEGIELIGNRYKQYLRTRLDETVENPIYSYMTLWESINGIGSWEKNPYVWVIEFERA